MNIPKLHEVLKRKLASETELRDLVRKNCSGSLNYHEGVVDVFNSVILKATRMLPDNPNEFKAALVAHSKEARVRRETAHFNDSEWTIYEDGQIDAYQTALEFANAYLNQGERTDAM